MKGDALGKTGTVESAERVTSAARAAARKRSNVSGRDVTQRLAFGCMWLAGLSAVAVLLLVVGYIILKGAKAISLDFLLTPPRGGLAAEGGISTTVVATLYLVVLTIGIATPLGVGAAVYLVEYAGEMQGRTGLLSRLVAVVRFGVETLAGVPSIIFGLFGYALFVTYLRFGFSLLSGALAGGCLILPVIIRASEEALRAVPRSYREASLALGATQWQTVWRVVVPTAMPGIVTSIVLSVGRVISETAVFYVTIGSSSKMPTSPLSPARTMALHLYYLASDTAAFEKAMGTGAILIVCMVLINAVISFLSRRLTAEMRPRGQ